MADIVVSIILAIMLAFFVAGITVTSIIVFIDWALQKWLDNSTEDEIADGIAWLFDQLERTRH